MADEAERLAAAEGLAAAASDARRRDRERTMAMLDLQEGRGPVPLLDDAGIAALFRVTHRIAVVGASADPGRPSYGVLRSLLDAGFDAVPINPNVTEVLGRPGFATVVAAAAATGPLDIVDVFRRSELCVPHAEEAVAIGARCLWLQLGVVSWEAARIAAEGGLAVVMDRCTAIELRRVHLR
ncbi:MAG: CoA-binding protein [Candidatus Limnocylindrales bacterium]